MLLRDPSSGEALNLFEAWRRGALGWPLEQHPGWVVGQDDGARFRQATSVLQHSDSLGEWAQPRGGGSALTLKELPEQLAHDHVVVDLLGGDPLGFEQGGDRGGVVAALPVGAGDVDVEHRPPFQQIRREGARIDGAGNLAWAHMLGFRGHWSTKSRRYSTTFTVLRRARAAFAKRRRARDGIPLDAFGRREDDQAVIVVASWVYVGSGYASEGERWLALSAAARARERRRIAREELTTTTASAAA
jgi:hypothetical protein